MRHRPEMGVIFFCTAIRIYSMLKDRPKRYFKCYQVGKKTYTVFVRVGYQWLAAIKLYIDGGEESRNEKKQWNGKLIRRFLLIITIADPE